MGPRGPENFGIDGNRFFNSVLSHAITLSGVAQWQYGQKPDPDARLAVHRCLYAATMRMRSGLPFVTEPQQCVALVKVASRVMASFAAAPEAAASVLLQPISNFLVALACRDPLCIVRQPAGPRRSLLASVQVVLEGPSPLLSAAGVAAHGPQLVLEAAWSVICALNIAALVPGSDNSSESLMAVQLLNPCQTLLADHETAAKLQERQCYPQCCLAYEEVLVIAAQLALVADAASQLTVTLLDAVLKPESGRQYRIGTLGKYQQQLLALSSAVAQPICMHSSLVELPGSTQPTSAYEGAALLAEVAKFQLQ